VEAADASGVLGEGVDEGDTDAVGVGVDEEAVLGEDADATLADVLGPAVAGPLSSLRIEAMAHVPPPATRTTPAITAAVTRLAFDPECLPTRHMVPAVRSHGRRLAHLGGVTPANSPFGARRPHPWPCTWP